MNQDIAIEAVTTQSEGVDWRGKLSIRRHIYLHSCYHTQESEISITACAASPWTAS